MSDQEHPKKKARKGSVAETAPVEAAPVESAPAASVAAPSAAIEKSVFVKSIPKKPDVSSPVPDGWKCVDSVLVHHYKDPKPSAKIAGFDFDGCLVNSKLGNDPNGWKIRYADLISKLTELVEQGFKFVIFTNESTDKFTSDASLKSVVDKKTQRLEGFLKAVGLPCQVFIMMLKDEYRKPDTKAWQLMANSYNGGVAVNLGESFFVGDAAGRPRDHSDCDKMFAKNLGVTFHLDNEFFKKKA